MLVSLAVLRVGDFLHPVHRLAIELFLNGDMRHGGGGRRAGPVLLAWLETHHNPPAYFADRPAFTLHPAAAGRHDERLAERMRMPSGASAGFKGDAGATRAGRRRRLEQWVDAHRAGEPICRSLG